MNQQLIARFVTARRNYISQQFSQLNPMQLEAVLTTEGPLLLLAGAGSGKTTVLIHRIANLMRFGRGSDTQELPPGLTEADVSFLEKLGEDPSEGERERAEALCAVDRAVPWSILAITFTNKAANEMKERLSGLLGPQARDIWAMTFHAACCRILRRDIECMGYTRGFTIYDASDSERLMKEILRDMNLDDKTFPPRVVLSAISREKDKLIYPQEMLDRAENNGDLRARQIALVYQRYQRELRENNALDFDDIIFVTVELLRGHEDIRRYYQNKFRYVLVDEYQDTNHAQYLLTALLSGGRENICVVGDDDQSIYRFRGATIENILNFESAYRGARTIRLEQNYRSTQAILDAANAVIANNRGRKGKRLWTDNGRGNPITVYEASDGGAEGNYVAGKILAGSRGRDFQDYAILYRTNAQSNALEYAMKRNGIPYRVFGGTRFFDRAEVKDMLSYLCVIHNPTDNLRLKRIINTPARGISPKTVEAAQRLAQAEDVPLYQIISRADSYGPLEKPAARLRQFCAMIEGLARLLEDGMSLTDFYDVVLARTGYEDMLSGKPTEENRTRLENIHELKSSIQSYVAEAEQPTLGGFLEEIALYTDLDQYTQGNNAVVMMTMHAAKGLEFPNVFLVGFEEGLFPGMRCFGDEAQMEEERRLCYVAITRAKKNLTITYARQRMLYGRTAATMPSRFLEEIPDGCIAKRAARTCPSYTTQTRKPQHPSSIKPIQDSGGPYLELNQGDMVHHNAFGRGMVLSVLKMGGDALLEIAFDEVGTKKLMAKTASRNMKKL